MGRSSREFRSALRFETVEALSSDASNCILRQDFTDLELVVYDNASDDGTIEVVEKYAHSDSRIRLSVNRSTSALMRI